MKISTVLSLILVIGAFIFSFAYMINDSKDYYPDSNVNISSWEEEYDYYEDINSSINQVKEPLEKLQDEDKGWILRTVEGVSAMPRAFVELVLIVLNSFRYAGRIILNTFSSIGIPAYLIAVILVMIIIWGVIKLIEAIQRWPL